jgi:prefoldin subunit 5
VDAKDIQIVRLTAQVQVLTDLMASLRQEIDMLKKNSGNSTRPVRCSADCECLS